jgi:hypothetical protein
MAHLVDMALIDTTTAPRGKPAAPGKLPPPPRKNARRPA